MKNSAAPFSRYKTIIILKEGHAIFSISISSLLQKIVVSIIALIFLYGIFMKVKLYRQSNTIAAISSQAQQVESENQKLAGELVKITSIIETIAPYFESSNPLDRNNKRADQIKQDLLNRITQLEQIINKTGADKQAGVRKQLNKIRRIKDSASEDEGVISIISNQIHQLIILEQIVDTLPVRAPFTGKFRKTSDFGMRSNPFGNNHKVFHGGIDLASELHAHIYSTAKGRVVFAGQKGGYGNMVEIDHGNGISTVYAHLSRVFVRKNQTIDKQSSVGIMGSSGRSTSPHLHYEIRVNKEQVDPSKFLLVTYDEAENI